MCLFTPIFNKSTNIIQCLQNVSEKQLEVSLGGIVRLSQKKNLLLRFNYTAGCGGWPTPLVPELGQRLVDLSSRLT